ncbi:MAG: hypothetical protein Q9181_005306 [Wetmoreana brouardii]
MTEECKPNESGMIACKESPSTVDQILAFEKATPQLAVACRNSSNDCVVSGPLSQLDHFEQICKIKPIKARRLEVPYGFHSPAMDPIVKRLEELGRSVTWFNPSIPIASNVHGRLLQPRDCQSNYFAMQSRQSVRFTDMVESIGADGGFSNSICVEIGPHPTVATLLKSITASNPCPCYPALRKDVDAWSSLNAMLSQFFLVKDDIRWREVFTDCQPATTNLPGYPLGGTDFQVAFSEPLSKSHDMIAPTYSETGFNLLPRVNLTESSGDSLVFETTSTILGALISGHIVGGTAICPASVYHELVVEAAQVVTTTVQDHVWMVSNMNFAHPLIYDPLSPTQTILLHLKKTGKDEFGARITSNEAESIQETAYFTATVLMLNTATTKPRRMREAAMVKRQSFYFTASSDHSTFRTRVLYERMFRRVVRYSKEYHTLKELHVSSSNMEGYGSFKLPKGLPTKNHIVPPAFTDTLLHAAGFIANLSVESEEICICSRVEFVQILYKDLDFGEPFTIYCNLFDDVQGSIFADAFVLDSAGHTIALCCGMEFKKLRLRTFQKAIQPAIKPEVLRVESFGMFPNSRRTATPPSAGAKTPKTADEEDKDIRRTIINIVTEACGFSEQDITQAPSLGAIGIDSLMQIEIASALKQAFPLSAIDQDTVAACDTIQSLEENIVSSVSARYPVRHDHRARSTTSGYKSPVNGHPNGRASTREAFSQNGHNSGLHHSGGDSPTTGLSNGSSATLGASLANGYGIRSHGSGVGTPVSGLQNEGLKPSSNPSAIKPSAVHISKNQKAPLFCFHDGSGQGNLYRRLGELNRTLYAFSDPDFATNNLRPSSLTQMAERYAATFSQSEAQSFILGGK